jgi:hypothetical protein
MTPGKKHAPIPEVATLMRMARERELEVVDDGKGKLTVHGGLVPVHWWPTSKRHTAYIDGAPRGYRFATPQNVINLATKGTTQ